MAGLGQEKRGEDGVRDEWWVEGKRWHVESKRKKAKEATRMSREGEKEDGEQLEDKE